MDQIEFETLELAIADRVARVRFTRPERANSLSDQVVADLGEVIRVVEDADHVRALCLTGSGGFFCGGLDKDVVERGVEDHAYFAARLEALTDVFRRLELLPVPTVAVVNGLARAGGLELVLSCDLALIDQDARIGDVHTGFGMPPGGGSSVRLPRRVGLQRATEIILTGRWLTGREAAEIGLVLRAVPGADLTAAADALLASLVDKGRGTLATTKRMLARSGDLSIEDGVRAERAEFLALLAAPGSDSVEGFTAWAQGRPPRWV